MYIATAVVFFYAIAAKDLLGPNEYQLAADHFTYVNAVTYLGFWPAIAINSNYFGPAVLLVLTNLNLNAIFFVNILILILAYFFSIRSAVHGLYFWFLIFLSPIIFFSLFSVNKEIISLLASILFIRYLQNRKMLFLFFSLLFFILVRKEAAGIFLLAAILTSHYFTSKQQYILLGLIVVFISFSFPYLYVERMEDFMRENITTTQGEGGGGLSILFSEIQNIPGGYLLVMIPKIFQNLIGSFARVHLLVNLTNMYNNFGVTLQSGLFLAFLLLLGVVSFVRPDALRGYSRYNKDILFVCVLYCCCFSIIPIVQTRYFIPVYILACHLMSHVIVVLRYGRESE